MKANQKKKPAKKAAKGTTPTEEQRLQKALQATRLAMLGKIEEMLPEGQHYMVTLSSKDEPPTTSIMDMHPADWLAYRASEGWDVDDYVIHMALPVSPVQSLKLQALYL
jgi:hypothetical protein